jgi:hypothetical protein
MIFTLCFGASVLFLIIFAFMTSRAPYGWEDDDSFHYGKKPE